jgi:hypothetical protein
MAPALAEQVAQHLDGGTTDARVVVSDLPGLTP